MISASHELSFVCSCEEKKMGKSNIISPPVISDFFSQLQTTIVQRRKRKKERNLVVLAVKSFNAKIEMSFFL